MRILRVFPRRTKATPEDDLSFVGEPPQSCWDADEVHVSCTFTWDKPEAERLAEVWGKRYSNVKLGGPAYNAAGGDFEPGKYLKPGYVITTRGCPNKCSFCFVPKREGDFRCLPVRDGWDVVDNNLLAAPIEHQERVFGMLKRQPARVRFTGGLEAGRITPWFVEKLAEIRLDILFLAFDREGQRRFVWEAARMLREAGFNKRKMACYVLVGEPGDTKEAAQERLMWVCDQGVTPFAMYFRGEDAEAKRPEEWREFVRLWCRPAGVWGQYKSLSKGRQSE